MKLYNSYIKKAKDGDIEDLIFIKNGFSLSALFFNFIWFSFHKMLNASIIFVIIIWVTMQLLGILGINGFPSFLLSFISTSLVIGVNANFWHSKYLRYKNYKFVGCFFGDSKEAAKLRFVEQYVGEVGEDVIKSYKFLDKQDRKLLKDRWKKEEKDLETKSNS